MSENTSVEQTPAPAQNLPPGSQKETGEVSLTLSQVVNACAVGMFICFFLPWINFFLGKPSGLDFAKEGGKFLLFWSIPIFSIITVFAGITKRSQKVIAQFTGALPFFALAYGFHLIGKDVLHLLEIGGYGSLSLGLALFILPRQLK